MLENRAVAGTSAARQLDPAREVRSRRWKRLRRQPRASTRRSSRGSASTTSWRRPSRSSSPRAGTTGGTATGRSVSSAATSATRGCASSSSRGRLLREPRRPHPSRFARRRQGDRAGDRDHPRDAAELPREQALVVPKLEAPRLALAVAGALASPRRPRRRTAGVDQLRLQRHDHLAVAPTASDEAAADGPQAEKIFLRSRRSRTGSSATRPSPPIDSSFKDGTWTVNVFSGRPARSRRARSTT